MSEAKKKELSFEEAVRRLETIAAELEKENIPLDDALKLYEEGVRLIRYCNTMLETAERKVQMLGIDQNGELQKIDFASENSN